MSSSQDDLVDGSSTPKPEQQTATDGIASNDAEQLKDEEMKALERQSFLYSLSQTIKILMHIATHS